MFECCDKDHYLQSVYKSITETLLIENPPQAYFDDRLKKLGLNGVYNSITNQIKISSDLFLNEDENEIKITIVHELSHFLLYRQNYKHGAHGWPFLVVCVLLSIRIDFNGDYILSSNIRNWRNGTNVQRWSHHFFVARDLIWLMLADEEIKNIDAHSLTTKVIMHKPRAAALIPEALARKAHKYFARTDGDIFLLGDSGVFFIVLSVAFMEIRLFAAFSTSLAIGLSYYALSKFFIKYNPAYNTVRYYLYKTFNRASHWLIYLPWNKR